MNKKEIKYGNVTVIQNSKNEWGVIDIDGQEIVPFGKYAWIDGFESGLARVRTEGMTWWTKEQLVGMWENGTLILDQEKVKRDTEKDMREHPEWNAKWGIINEKGEEVLPVIYDSVWKFFGQNRISTKAEKDGETIEIYFHDLKSCHSTPIIDRSSSSLQAKNVKYQTQNEMEDKKPSSPYYTESNVIKEDKRPTLENVTKDFSGLRLTDFNKFTCPCCGKELPIDSAIIRTITKSKHINTHSQGRFIVRTYQNTPFEIRLCPHCAKKSSILKNVTIALLIIVPIIFSCLFAKNIGLFFVGIFASAIPTTFIIGFIIWLIDLTNILGTRIDIKHARKCNAINKGGDWWEL